MKQRIIFPILTVALVSFASCEKQDMSDFDASESSPWQFVMTKAGTAHTDEARTYRASLLHNGLGWLVADGTYSGYYTENHWQETNGYAWPYPGSDWLYPCRTDGEGVALDTNGDPIAWDDAGWFAKTDKASKYALRGPNRSDLTYALVMTSPAQEMVGFRRPGEPVLTGTDRTNPEKYHWGFPLDRRESHWAVSPVVAGRNITAADFIDGNHVFSFTPTLLEHRSMLTVKLACGTLSSTNISKVYFENVMSFAYYVPPRGNEGNTPSRTGNYENVVMDGNTAGDSSFDPLVGYYTENTYPTAPGASAGVGEKFIAPADAPAHLVRRDGQSIDVTHTDEWQSLTDEWVRGGSGDYNVLTAIRDFPIMPLDYSTPEGDDYFYRDIMPKVVVYTGAEGDIKTTVLLDAKFEPMKKYTMYIFVSSAYIRAYLTVSDWTVFQFWPEGDSEHPERDVLDVSFGSSEKLVGSLTVSDWEGDTTPDDDNFTDTGVIENPPAPGSGE